MNLRHVSRIIAVGALLLSPFAGCVVKTESEPKVPAQKGGVNVKVDHKNGLDVDVDVKKPSTP